MNSWCLQTPHMNRNPPNEIYYASKYCRNYNIKTTISQETAICILPKIHPCQRNKLLYCLCFIDLSLFHISFIQAHLAVNLILLSSISLKLFKKRISSRVVVSFLESKRIMYKFPNPTMSGGIKKYASVKISDTCFLSFIIFCIIKHL